MATTFTKVLIHFIFSTKSREPFITSTIEPMLYAYMRGIANNHHSPVIAIHGVADHIHMLISMSKTITIADLMENVKKDSSRWIKAQSSDFSAFRWQEGYAGFSIGESAVEQVTRYIANQKRHHRRTPFKTELLMFLRKYKVEYDERYIWT